MTDFYNEQWYTDRWLSMPPEMRKLAADTIAEKITDEDKELIRRKHAEHGHDWIHHLIDIDPEETPLLHEMGMTTFSAHHGWGTSIRNLLRDAGITDSDVPDAPYESGFSQRCLDDYYVQAIEAAVGLRDL